MCGLERLGQYRCGCLSPFGLLRKSVRRVRSGHSQTDAQAIIMRIRSFRELFCSSERRDYHRVDGDSNRDRLGRTRFIKFATTWPKRAWRSEIQSQECRAEGQRCRGAEVQRSTAAEARSSALQPLCTSAPLHWPSCCYACCALRGEIIL